MSPGNGGLSRLGSGTCSRRVVFQGQEKQQSQKYFSSRCIEVTWLRVLIESQYDINHSCHRSTIRSLLIYSCCDKGSLGAAMQRDIF